MIFTGKVMKHSQHYSPREKSFINFFISVHQLTLTEIQTSSYKVIYSIINNLCSFISANITTSTPVHHCKIYKGKILTRILEIVFLVMLGLDFQLDVIHGIHFIQKGLKSHQYTTLFLRSMIKKDFRQMNALSLKKTDFFDNPSSDLID